MRRTPALADEAPVTFNLPGVVDGAPVSSWSLERGGPRAQATGLNLTRQTDVNSPRVSQALTNGSRGVTATLVVRKLTPLGWVRQVTVTMNDCMVSSYKQSDGDSESIGLTFSRIQVEP